MVGVRISFDYTWSLWGLDPESEEYKKAITSCHLRGAELLKNGCLKNGGLYVKLGQGLVSLNHLLPPEYIMILSSLQDQALHRHSDEVSLEVLFLIGSLFLCGNFISFLNEKIIYTIIRCKIF